MYICSCFWIEVKVLIGNLLEDPQDNSAWNPRYLVTNAFRFHWCHQDLMETGWTLFNWTKTHWWFQTLPSMDYNCSDIFVGKNPFYLLLFSWCFLFISRSKKLFSCQNWSFPVEFPLNHPVFQWTFPLSIFFHGLQHPLNFHVKNGWQWVVALLVSIGTWVLIITPNRQVGHLEVWDKSHLNLI